MEEASTSTSSPSDGDDVRWYFSKVPLKQNVPASSMPINEIVGKAEFLRFSKSDSLALEQAYLEKEEELLSAWWKEYAYCSQGPAGASGMDDFEVGRGESSLREDGVGVIVKGGLYEVDLLQRRCYPVYWHGEDRRVMRGSWFARKGGLDWLPLREDVAEQLEIAYRRRVWHRRGFQPSGLYAARVNLTSSVTGLHALFEGEDATWQAWLTADSAGLQYFFGFGSGSSPGIPLRRGFAYSNTAQPSQEELRQQKEEQFDDYASQVPVKHLIFMVHGIGQRLERANLVDDVSLFQNQCAQMAEQHLTQNQRNAQRVLFIPCQWRRGLVLAGESLVDDITMEGLRGIRETVNRTVLDVLYYMSPAYCQDIIDSVTASLNSLYRKFLKRNPGYDGKVSLYGHSLGSVLSYDILCHQEAPIFTPRSPLPVSSIPETTGRVEAAEIVHKKSTEGKEIQEVVSASSFEEPAIGKGAVEVHGSSVGHEASEKVGASHAGLPNKEVQGSGEGRDSEAEVPGQQVTVPEGEGSGNVLQAEVSCEQPPGNVSESDRVAGLSEGNNVLEPPERNGDAHIVEPTGSNDDRGDTSHKDDLVLEPRGGEEALVEVEAENVDSIAEKEDEQEDIAQGKGLVTTDDSGSNIAAVLPEIEIKLSSPQAEAEEENRQGYAQGETVVTQGQGRKEHVAVDDNESHSLEEVIHDSNEPLGGESERTAVVPDHLSELIGSRLIPMDPALSSQHSTGSAGHEASRMSADPDVDVRANGSGVAGSDVVLEESKIEGDAVVEESGGASHAVAEHILWDAGVAAVAPTEITDLNLPASSSGGESDGIRSEGSREAVAECPSLRLVRVPNQGDRKSGRRRHMPRIAYSKLDFEVDHFFAVGSPLGLFLALRNVRLGIGGGERARHDGTSEEMPACHIMMNIFHPFDPVAYRLEPLVSNEFTKRKPVQVPFHKGGKRLHIGIQEMTQDLSARLQSLPRQAWDSISAIPTKVIAAFSAASDKGKEKHSDDESVEVDDYISQVMERLSGSTDGRLDYMLQDDTFQPQFLAALSSHTAYWGDADTALFVLKHLYKDIPEYPAAEPSSSSTPSSSQRVSMG